MKKALLIISLILLQILKVGAASQDLDFSSNEYTQHIQAGGSFSITINDGSALSATWTITETDGTLAAVGLSISPLSANTVTISGTAIAGKVAFQLSSSRFATPRTYHFIIRKPYNLIFVLDKSGSMECPPGTLNWPDCATQNPKRWTFLKNAMNHIVAKFNNETGAASESQYKLTGDKMSAIFFDGDVNLSDNVPSQATGLFEPSCLTKMATLYPPQLGRNGTSFGDGLAAAVAQISPAAEEKVIVLVTDGEQNTDRLVQAATPRAGRDFTDGTDIGLDVYKVHTIGIGVQTTPNAFRDLLTNIKNAGLTGGTAFFTGNDDPTGATLIANDIYNSIFKGFTPQIISKSNHFFTQSQCSQTFSCNDKVSRLFFEGFFNNDITKTCKYFSLKKDSIDVSQYAKIDKFGTSVMLTMDFNKVSNVSSKGNWEFSCYCDVSSKESATLVATADDHNYEFELTRNKQSYVVGDNLSPTVKVTKYGKPVTDAKVTAFLIGPNEDLGELLSVKPMPSLMPALSTESGTIATRKITGLLNSDADFVQKISSRSKSNLISLEYKGNGLYSTNIDLLNNTGDYKLMAFVEKDDSTDGKVIRLLTETIVPRFGAIDWNLSKVIKQSKLGSDGMTFTTMNITPIYTIGGKNRHLGPGFAQAIGTDNSAVKFDKIEDNGDGSYTIDLVSKGNPKFNFYIENDNPYKGTVNGLDKPYIKYRWGLSAHTGVVFPYGKLDSLYSPSIFFEGDFNYWLTPKIGLEAIGGYYTFAKNYAVTGASLLAKYKTINAANRWNITWAAGAGMYKPKSLATASGFCARIIASKNINEHLEFNVNGGFISIPKYDYVFFPISVGVKYIF
jgi:hypothetical protein